MMDILAHAITSRNGTVRGSRNKVRGEIKRFSDLSSPVEKDEEQFHHTEAGCLVLYTTSLHVVRVVHTACQRARAILQNHAVIFEERNLLFAAEFQRELKVRLPEAQPPQLFINGQHFGGLQEMEASNEAGQLAKILNAFPRLREFSPCNNCGGYRCLPCQACQGSRKIVRGTSATGHGNCIFTLRCSQCNENGLVPCPVCSGRSLQLRGRFGGSGYRRQRLQIS